MRNLALGAITIFVMAFMINPADARRAQKSIGPVTEFCGDRYCPVGMTVRQVTAPAPTRVAARMQTRGEDVTIIGGRPADCPHRYCGCGLRKFLGINDKRLNLAWNWAKLYPRLSGPRVGAAAVRRGHVMYIEAPAGDGQWLIRDYNSGGGLSRLHVRGVRGYVFVDPHAHLASR